MGVDVSGVMGAAEEMASHAAGVLAKSTAVEHEFAEQARGLIAARAPRGEGTDGEHYADSFRVDGNTVGTDKEQGFRLELGFHGADSLGRVYSQSPRPHVGPAADALEEPFWAAVEALAEE